MNDRACVLIVDDEEPNRLLLHAMLRGQHDTLQASSGPEALRILEEKRVDLVLLDVMMPGTSGYAVCSSIKAMPRDSFLPVLLVTALSAQDDRNQGLEAGADDFLTKPVDRRELLLRTRAFLKLRAQEAQIRAQLEALARLQAMKDDLLSLLVHDMRSPLSGIIAHLHILLEELPAEGPQREDATFAMHAADAMAAALEEALQVRLLEEGQLPIRRSGVDLHALLAGTMETLGAVARRRNVKLRTAVEGDPVASLDGKLVRRSIENLVGNALKYTPAEKEVSIVLRHRGGNVELEVADRGVGIPAELQAGMFEKFGSVEAKKGGPRKGFGLGLYLVKLVAEGHGGTASVQDHEGGGAVFRMLLPTG